MNLLSKFRKLLIDPWRYGWQDYNTALYWRDRYRRWGDDIRGPGNEARSVHDNELQYRIDYMRFAELLEKCRVSLKDKRVLDIGCGSGRYTKICRDAGVKSYCGIDIINQPLEELRREYPGYDFQWMDITEEALFWCVPRSDVVLMIDVVEYITSRDKLRSALLNAMLMCNDLLVVGPTDPRRSRLFYLRGWQEKDLTPGWKIAGRVPFKRGELLGLR